MKNNVFALERKRLKLTQSQLAKKLNTSRSNVANWENGQNMPSIELLIKCSDIFDCDVMYLCGYQNDRKEKDDDRPEPVYEERNENDNVKTELETLNFFFHSREVFNRNEELDEESYKKLINFIKANKQFILNNKKDNKQQKQQE